MTRLVSLLLLLALPLSIGCGASAATSPATIVEGEPQAVELVHGDGARVGWVVFGHDAGVMRVDFVMNPGFTASSVSLCASGEAFGWRSPALCERQAQGPFGSATMTVPLAELAAECDRPMWFQASADVADAGAAYAGGFKTRVAIVPACGAVASGCVKTAKQWLGEEWPLEGGDKLGGVYYGEEELAELLALDAPTDASVLVAKNVIAARLNIASGAQAGVAPAAALAMAEEWLEGFGDARLPYGLKVSPDGVPNLPEWDAGANLAAVIDRFNEGFAGAARCDR